jgi:hypothetical protein
MSAENWKSKKLLNRNKSYTTEMKNSFDGLKSRLYMLEEKSNDSWRSI